MAPYYIIMRLPGEPQAEFFLMLPMVPSRRDNMIAWLAARCDPPVSLSETYALKYWWCSPPRTGIASGRPTVWTARGTGASLCSDRCVRASL